MTTILFNLFLAIGIVGLLAAVCRIPFRLNAPEGRDELAARRDLQAGRELDRRAA